MTYLRKAYYCLRCPNVARQLKAKIDELFKLYREEIEDYKKESGFSEIIIKITACATITDNDDEQMN